MHRSKSITIVSTTDKRDQQEIADYVNEYLANDSLTLQAKAEDTERERWAKALAPRTTPRPVAKRRVRLAPYFVTVVLVCVGYIIWRLTCMP